MLIIVHSATYLILEKFIFVLIPIQQNFINNYIQFKKMLMTYLCTYDMIYNDFCIIDLTIN